MNNWIDITVIAVYLAGTTLFGCLFYFRKTAGDKANTFMTGGGKLPTWVIALSVFATHVSSISFLALPEGGVRRKLVGVDQFDHRAVGHARRGGVVCAVLPKSHERIGVFVSREAVWLVGARVCERVLSRDAERALRDHPADALDTREPAARLLLRVDHTCPQ